MLTLELESGESPIAKLFPKFAFCIGLVVAKFTRIYMQACVPQSTFDSLPFDHDPLTLPSLPKGERENN